MPVIALIREPRREQRDPRIVFLTDLDPLADIKLPTGERPPPKHINPGNQLALPITAVLHRLRQLPLLPLVVREEKVTDFEEHLAVMGPRRVYLVFGVYLRLPPNLATRDDRVVPDDSPVRDRFFHPFREIGDPVAEKPGVVDRCLDVDEPALESVVLGHCD